MQHVTAEPSQEEEVAVGTARSVAMVDGMALAINGAAQLAQRDWLAVVR